MIQGFYDGDISMGSWSGSAPVVPGSMTCAAAAAAKATKATTTEPFDPDNASPSMAFGVEEAPDSVSSISSFPSSSSSSDDGDHHTSFFTPQQQHSPSASSLCFGAGGPAGWLLRRSRGARARSPWKPQETTAAAAAKGDVVGWWYLRKISRRLTKARTTPGKGSPFHPAADDTARERAESVACAVAYCKDTLRRGAVPHRRPPLPTLDDWLHNRQEEIMASAAAYCNECRVSQSPPPRSRRAGWLSEMPAMEKQAKVSTRLPSPSRDVAVAHGHDAIGKCRGEAAMSSAPSNLETDELEIRTGSFDEMEFLKIFDGDTEMIARHFITIHLDKLKNMSHQSFRH